MRGKRTAVALKVSVGLAVVVVVAIAFVLLRDRSSPTGQATGVSGKGMTEVVVDPGSEELSAKEGMWMSSLTVITCGKLLGDGPAEPPVDFSVDCDLLGHKASFLDWIDEMEAYTACVRMRLEELAAEVADMREAVGGTWTDHTGSSAGCTAVIPDDASAPDGDELAGSFKTAFSLVELDCDTEIKEIILDKSMKFGTAFEACSYVPDEDTKVKAVFKCGAFESIDEECAAYSLGIMALWWTLPSYFPGYAGVYTEGPPLDLDCVDHLEFIGEFAAGMVDMMVSVADDVESFDDVMAGMEGMTEGCLLILRTQLTHYESSLEHVLGEMDEDLGTLEGAISAAAECVGDLDWYECSYLKGK